MCQCVCLRSLFPGLCSRGGAEERESVLSLPAPSIHHNESGCNETVRLQPTSPGNHTNTMAPTHTTPTRVRVCVHTSVSACDTAHVCVSTCECDSARVSAYCILCECANVHNANTQSAGAHNTNAPVCVCVCVCVCVRACSCAQTLFIYESCPRAEIV